MGSRGFYSQFESVIDSTYHYDLSLDLLESPP